VRDGEKLMILRVLGFGRAAALLMFALCFGIGFGSAPAAACGYYGCYAPAAVVVQPYYQSCSCCSCGGGYAAYGYAYPSPYYGVYAAGYDYDYYAPRWRHRYWGPRRWW
jgi:hypothetical protein